MISEIQNTLFIFTFYKKQSVLNKSTFEILLLTIIT